MNAIPASATSFLTETEIQSVGFKNVGENVKISRKASIYNPANITICNNVRIDDFCVLSPGDGFISIGNYVHIACHACLFGKGGILLSDFSGISSGCAVYSATDDYLGEGLVGPTVPDEYRKLEVGCIVFKELSVIGARSVILPGVTLGEGTSVGALSLVNKNLDPWSIYFGVPARRIGIRLKKIQELKYAFLHAQKSYHSTP